MTSQHPFIQHYETQDEHKRNEQHAVIKMLYFQYGKNMMRVESALVLLGWNESEAREAVRYAIKSI